MQQNGRRSRPREHLGNWDRRAWSPLLTLFGRRQAFFCRALETH
jgi:hypothetical protein